jgi:hypothetical protein
MATKTVTIDTGEWIYPDSSGSPHTVTNAETFTFELTDGGAAAVKWANDIDGSVVCDDGSRITLRPQASQSQVGTAAANGTIGNWGLTADAQQGAVQYGLPGEFVASHSSTNIPQYWKLATINANDADAPTSITAKFEDQFGNSFTWTTVTVS